MTFERARELAQALQLRDQARLGLANLLPTTGFDAPVAVKRSMQSLALTYVGAQEAIERIVGTDA